MSSPDVTARVMQRLGYQNVSATRARQLRRKGILLRALQGCAILSAIVLGGVWWFDGGVPAARGPEVVETLRGSFTKGSSELNGFLAALPRLPQNSNPDQTAVNGPAVEANSAGLDSTPHLRTY